MSSESQFFSQLSGGTAANMVFVIAFLIYRVVGSKCKHSTCKAKSACLECTAQEDSIENSKSTDEGLHRQIEDLENQLRSFATNLCSKRKTITLLAPPKQTSSNNIVVALKQGAPEKI